MPQLEPTSTRNAGWRERLRYRLDRLWSRGTWAVLLWLGLITLAVVLVSSALLAVFGVTLTGSSDGSWLEDFWQSLLRTLDTGTMAGDVGWGRRVLALLVTVVGLLIAGTLIGIIASGVEQRVDQMQRGRGRVLESDHIVILGASSRLPVIIEQLALARRTRKTNSIVVLADREPADLRDEIRSGASTHHKSRVVIRSGDPTRRWDLSMAAVSDARAVIAISDDEVRGDAGVVKAVLAAGAELGGFDRIPIVAELNDLETAASLLEACGGAIHPLIASQAIARIAEFALREPGLNQVIEELMDFRGSDIYIREPGELPGSTFGEAVFRFAKARPIGLIRASGVVEINPGPETVTTEFDRLIVIADDDEPLEPAGNSGPVHLPAPISAPILHGGPAEEHFVILGWNALGSQLIRQLEASTASSSTAEILYDPTLLDADEIEVPEGGALQVTLTPNKSMTMKLGARERITSIVLLGYRRVLPPGEADSRTLLNLMSIRRELTERDAPMPRLIVELLDSDNVDLARMSGADDYVLSDAMTSRLIAQLAEQPQRRAVLLSINGPDGPSMHLISAADLVAGVEADTPVTWETIVSAAYSVGLLAIGWRDEDRGDVTLNPRTSEIIDLGDGDEIVVIA